MTAPYAASLADIRRRWPDSPESRLAMAHYYYTVERDYARALPEFHAFETAYPNDVEVILGLSGSYKRLGQFQKQLPYARRLATLDPESSNSNLELAIAYRFNGMVEEALTLVEEGYRRFPQEPSWALYRARWSYELLADPGPMVAFGERLREDGRWGSAYTRP